MILFIFKTYIIIIIVNIILLVASTSAKLDTAVSNIFCSGKLLHYVQMSRIFNDSKYFVDMKSKFPPDKVEQDFGKLLNTTDNNPDKSKLKDFVENNFDLPGAGFEPWIPEDWKIKPVFIDNIYDFHLRSWAKDLNALWKNLGVVINNDVLKNSSLYSLLYVPHPFIVPGRRFMELYHWDSYWVIEGLILSEMFKSAQNMLINFLYLVERYGYVPYGGRVYYLGRSQPPFLIPMFDLYWKATKNITFLEESVYILEKEFNFWMNNRSVTIMKDGIKYEVFQYNVNSSEPRPESYYEDVMNAHGLDNESRAEFFSGIRSAAESGWDFSSRWFLSNGKRTNNFADIHPNYLAPICLNSILGYNAKLLSEFFLILGNKTKSEEYWLIAENINRTIGRVFWDENEGIWFDYNIISNELQPGFYPSSLVPLWAETYGVERDVAYIADRVLSYLKDMNVTSFPGGIPTSLRNSTQQWDFPNGWAPLQYFVILGLRKIGERDNRASTLAYSLAEKWVLNCYEAYLNSTPHSVYDTYDVTHIGFPGGERKYTDQKVFGWTSGVVMKFLSLYSHQIRLSHVKDPAPVIVAVVLFTISILAVVSYVHRLRDSDNLKSRKVSRIRNKENFV